LSGIARHRVESPLELARVDVISGYVAADTATIHVDAAVPDDGEVVGDVDRARAGIREFVVGDSVHLPQLLAGFGFERVKAPIDRCDVDLALPHRNTSIDEIAAGISGGERVRPRIEFPQLLAGRGIDGVDISQVPDVYMTPSTTIGVASWSRVVAKS